MESIYKYTYNKEKDKKLKAERGIGFEEIISLLEAGKTRAIVAHPNQAKYPDQHIYVIEHKNYAYNVPFTQKDTIIHLITIFPSRKATKKFLSKT